MLNIVVVVDRSFVMTFVHMHMLIPYVQYVVVVNFLMHINRGTYWLMLS